MAYELELPTELVVVHLVFHIFFLKNCVGDPASITFIECVSMKDILNEILYRQVPRLRSKEVTSVKVLWRS